MEFHDPNTELKSHRCHSPSDPVVANLAWRHLNTGSVLHGGRRASHPHTLADLTAYGQHHNGLASFHLGRSQTRPPRPLPKNIISTTHLLQSRNRTAAKETPERCAHAFIGRVTLSQEPAREGRGFPALSGSFPRLVTLIGVGGRDSTHASQEWAGWGGGRGKADR